MHHDTNLVEDFETEELAPGGTLLYGQYTIERHLIDGGFGMTYLARDSLERQVVIKECFPGAICRRVKGEVRPRRPDYQEQYQGVISNFLREALRLAKFEHPNIVKVHQVFQENNTAYIAMDYVDGMDLLSMLDIDPGRLTDSVLKSLLRETLSALDYVHGFGMLHRDISPDNLLLDADNKLTLIDFGAAREDLSKKSRALSTVMSVKDGYSPHEFYYTDGSQQPSSDIYSVGATFYHLITGYAPPDCQKRVAALSSDQPDPYKPLADGAWALDRVFLEAIDKSLSVPQRERFQSAGEWLNYLEANVSTPGPSIPVSIEEQPVAANTPAPVPAADTPPEPQPVAEKTPEDVDLGPDLARVISSLVQNTNSEITPTNWQELKRKKAEEEAAKLAQKDNRLFDIFGQPIEDVDKWLKEQDKQSKKQRPAPKTDDKSNELYHPEPAEEESSGFGLSRVLGKFTKMRRRSAAVGQT